MRREPKIVTIVGARPQFVKLEPLCRELARTRVKHVLVHTGQHYDRAMSDVFFEEMRLPAADHHLGIGSGSHGEQTSKMLASIEQVLLSEKPAVVVVLGDTNSTLAGALAAAKLHIPVAHIEAGLRSFNRQMPEEINRVLTDHVSDVLLCPTAVARKNLRKEGIRSGVHVTGDIMVDALKHFLPQARRRPALKNLGVEPKEYFLLTVHRPVNADHDEHLQGILNGCFRLSHPVVFPVHPRTRDRASRLLSAAPRDRFRLVPPLGYLDMLAVMASARAILTDSGGVQKEALYLDVPCITLRDETEWTETLRRGWNQLVRPTAKAIVAAARKPPRGRAPRPYGDGRAAKAITRVLLRLATSR